MGAGLQVALLVALILPAVKVAASLCSRVGIPPILGELMVGVVLGPGALNLRHGKSRSCSRWRWPPCWAASPC